MVIGDMFSMTAQNPLIGPNLDEFGPRFPDMSCAFDKELRALAHDCAKEQGFTLREGVYAQMTGPTYETPAEIRMLRVLGADAVGMSTVPEVVVARHGGTRVLGISCITNMAAGILDQPLNHAEVTETANRVKGQFRALLDAVIENSFDGIYITDGDANTIKVNKAYELITGLKRSEVIGCNMRDLMKQNIISVSGV